MNIETKEKYTIEDIEKALYISGIRLTSQTEKFLKVLVSDKESTEAERIEKTLSEGY